MSEPPYRDDATGLRTQLDQANAACTAAEARVVALEQEVLLASGVRPWRSRIAFIMIVALGSALLGAFALDSIRAGDDAALAQRILSMPSGEIRMWRDSDRTRCSLTFRHRDLDEYGHVVAYCETRVACEHEDTPAYYGLTHCPGHRYLRDTEPVESDGDGLVDIDLIGGTAVVDGASFHF